jgi:uncharacterized OB-fold protein
VSAPPPTRERPEISRDNAFFWEGVAAGELRLQRCGACGVFRHPPRPACASCASGEWDWVRSDGAGVIYSYTVVHHPPVPGRAMPHPVVLVELTEGVRILGPLVGAAIDRVTIGTPVRAVFPVLDGAVDLSFSPIGEN